MIHLTQDPILDGLIGISGVILGFIAWGIWEWRIYKTLDRRGIESDARIIKMGKIWFLRSNSYYVIYQFQPNKENSAVYIRRQAIIYRHYKIWQENEVVTVSYLPEKPQRSRLAGKHEDLTKRDDSIGTAIVLVLVSLGVYLFSQSISSPK